MVDTSGGPCAASRVVLATPASVTADLIKPFCPAAATLREIVYSSVVVVIEVESLRQRHPRRTPRIGGPRRLSLGHRAIITDLIAELGDTMGLDGDPIARVTQWRDALPQFAPGHLDRMAEIEGEITVRTAGVKATGAAFRGLGLPSCLRQGRQAART